MTTDQAAKTLTACNTYAEFVAFCRNNRYTPTIRTNYRTRAEQTAAKVLQRALIADDVRYFAG